MSLFVRRSPISNEGVIHLWLHLYLRLNDVDEAMEAQCLSWRGCVATYARGLPPILRR
jgi:hypothetical protein